MFLLREFDELLEEISAEEFGAIVNKPPTPERVAKFNEKLYAAKIMLQRKSPYFGAIVTQMSLVPTTKIPTMAVDDFGNLYINPNFTLDILSVNETVGVLAHEAFHILNGTFDRGKYKDHELWNIATDYIMNRDLIDDGHELPSLGLIPAKKGGSFYITNKEFNINDLDITDLTANALYDILEQAQQKNPKQEPQDGQGGEPQQGGKPQDGQGGEPQGGQGKEPQQGGSGEKFDEHIKSSEKKPERSEEWGGDDPRDSSEISDDQKKAIMDRMVKDAKKAAEEMIQNAGQGGGAPKGLDLSRFDYTVHNWKALLRQFIDRSGKIKPDYMRPSIKHAAAGYYQPKMRVEKEKIDVCIAIDTSGSVSEQVLRTFLSEIRSLVNSFKEVRMRILLWHSSVYWDQVLEKPKLTQHKIEEILKGAPYESGGTEFSSVANRINKNKPEENILIVFTDGHFFGETIPKIKVKKREAGIFFMIQEPGGTTKHVEGISRNIHHVEVPK